ncbi:cyclopropane-fatty-acyl-phospholipid synthase family protein [Asticcacaulis sp. EMRT-3]|uniref:cyclopropane-fatty-acyl-phospholipid synthase family protein n=1 Tax=Asticcacaulis sp. EMRT-3 TaxID=3040349 RepID=UPI0024AFDBE0|nr:cyclopropane-fatty-acyl-phospholipid synthase family protein [Asticcacaulis sp. EMRT-3]MDI7775853.1 cyclopropane-fatty-acyl-phospholipid synthase family protein [Asticcacaulis sp. EMRT-3]
MLHAYLSKLIKRGRLTVRVNPNTRWQFGEVIPDRPDLDVAIWFSSRWSAIKVGLNPYLFFGEAYMDGDLIVEKGSLWDLMELVGLNMRALPRRPALFRLFNRLKQFLPAHSLAASRQNVAHHYDLSERLYRLFLDEDMQYSCAYFRDPGMTLEEAQTAKRDHIADKLMLSPGQNVLDIGCGWGGMALHLAKRAQVNVTGVTLSTEQLAVAEQRAQGPDVNARVRFALCDYRQVEGQFDRIVSVGMFEHVGKAAFDTYFETVYDRLKDDGVALIHTIGRRGESGARSAWLDKYIFPGGYIPSLSEITKSVERAGLWITDVEPLRLHYAETLKCWRERFMAHRAEIQDLYDERFCRMWEFYLAFCELGFRHADLMVFQVQIAKRIDTLPMTRDYMMAREMSAEVVSFEEESRKLRERPRRVQ